jgi:nucleoside-diphosphate-sugar epimerase
VTLPRVILTGSSGFIGRRLLEALKGRYEIYGLARRSQSRSGAPEHSTIHWAQVDIADEDRLRAAFREIGRAGSVETVIHLAAHYDFEEGNDDEYYRTNVDGLRNVLECSREIGVNNFIFSSSLAACAFPDEGGVLTEESAPDGDHVYAKTKAIGEAMLAEYADEMRTITIRFAALFSDWCEYPPVFMFIGTWLSKAWNNRVLGGRGHSAIPYLHVRDGVRFVERTLDCLDDLESGEILIASSDEVVTHNELYHAVTHYYYGESPIPWYVPRFMTGPGIRIRCLIGRFSGSMPFERPWMAKYVDKQMKVDASHTRRRLGWEPRQRLRLLRRISFLLENLKSDPAQWNTRNRAAMKYVHMRPNLRVSQLLVKHREELTRRYTTALTARAESGELPSYLGVDFDEHRWNHRLVLRNLINAVRTRDRSIFLAYCEDLAERRWEQGFSADDLCGALDILNQVCLEVLLEDDEVGEVEMYFHEHISVTIRFGVDHVIEVFELMEHRRRGERATGPGSPAH